MSRKRNERGPGLLIEMSDVSITLLGASLAIHPAALDLPPALGEWVTMLIITCGGGRRCKLRPSPRAMVALVYLREHTTLAKIAAGFGISESTVHAYTSAVVDLLAERAPGLLRMLREHEPDSVPLDGTLAERDRVGGGLPTLTGGQGGLQRDLVLRSVVNLRVNTWRYTSDPPDGDVDGLVIAAEAEGCPESRSAAARVALTGSAESPGMSEGGFRTQTAP